MQNIRLTNTHKIHHFGPYSSDTSSLELLLTNDDTPLQPVKKVDVRSRYSRSKAEFALPLPRRHRSRGTTTQLRPLLLHRK
jgi:hypothetical protein